MKTKLLLLCGAGLLVALTRASAAIHYVDAASTNAVPPFTNWANAAAVIQDAVDGAVDGDTVLVTNGVYATGGRPASGTSLTNRVCVDRAITLRSVNGPNSTLINGMGNGRCAYLTNGAALTGFTLTNGTTQIDGDLYPDNCGGGAYCEGLSGILSNCVVARCWAYEDGGGTFSGTLNDCVLIGNSADYRGGGAYGTTLENCILTGNSAESGGGGAYLGTLNGCTITNNAADDGGGATLGALTNCLVNGNSAGSYGGGARDCTLNNCVLTGNSAGYLGGGAYDSTLTNCTLTGNAADSPWSSQTSGGGAYASTLNNCTLQSNHADSGGGARDCTLNNCALTGNSTGEGGGGGALWSTLNNCTLTGNHASAGGGAVLSTLTNCMLSGNIAYEDGGGAFESTLYNCTLTNNWGSDYGGGAFVCTLYNCTLTSNRVSYYGGGASRCTLNNCTVTGNSAGRDAGGAGGGTSECVLNNCIVYYNNSYTSGANYFGDTFNYSCTTPDPGSGVGNITNAPLFVNTNGWSNLRLQSNSPCINAGNNAYVTGATDLDGNPRIAGGTVDMGAYEFQFPASTISYAWLQHYRLPTDGSADFGDPDGDRLNNWQEWRCGTDPTNALSVLRLLPAVPAAGGLALTWLSVTNRSYLLERSTNQSGTPSFFPLATLPGQPATNTFTDTNVPPGTAFYRVLALP